MCNERMNVQMKHMTVLRSKQMAIVKYYILKAFNTSSLYMAHYIRCLAEKTDSRFGAHKEYACWQKTRSTIRLH